MPEHTLLWDGDEWEEHSMTLVRIRCAQHNRVFQKVPADDAGDCGIEAFSSDGTVYQCYAPNGQLKIGDRYEAQRDKLTEDLAKLEKNETKLAVILGQTKIKRYVFLVPLHDSKRLNEHAKTKAAECRAKNLTIVDADFDVWIQTEADFPLESQAMLDARLSRLTLGPIVVDDDRLAAIVEANPDLVARIEGKLEKIPTLPAISREAFRNHIVRHLERGADAEAAVRDAYPGGWELFLATRAAKEVSLEIESLITPLEPNEFLHATVTELRALYAAELSFLGPVEIEMLAWGTVADWLATCPLDFAQGAAA